MPLDTVASPDVKQTAKNMVQNATDKAAGKGAPTNKIPSSKGPEVPEDGDEKGKPIASLPDPNAGKEKYSVEGRDVWLTPEQARSYVQKGIAFEPRVSELDRMKREFVLFEQALIDNPGAIIANIAKRKNVPIQSLVENVLESNASDEVKEGVGKWYWERVAKRHQMDPKDREILERDEKIAAYENQEKMKAAMAIVNENKMRVEAAFNDLRSKMIEVHKEFGFKNPDSALATHMVKRAAQIMQLAGLEKRPITPKDAVTMARKEFKQVQSYLYDELEPEALVEELGKDNAEKVRKFLLKLVKQNEKEVKSEGASPSKRGERKVITPDDFHDYLEDLKRNGK